MHITRYALSALVLSLALGCTGKEAVSGEAVQDENQDEEQPVEKVEPATMSDEELSEAFVALVNQLATTAQKHATIEDDEIQKVDCDALATDLGGVIDEHKAVIAAARNLDQDDQRATAMQERIGAEVEKTLGEKVAPVLTHDSCAEHEALKKAVARMQLISG